MAPACSVRHSVSAPDCSSGARSLSHQGDHVYPDMGNGGYRSVHTDVHLVYDATSNLFLPGTEAELSDRATQCPSPSSTYTRPGIAYIALRQILGSDNFDRGLQSLQRRYGGATITETQLETGFREALLNHSVACQAKLGTFFSQWFDTNYPTANGAIKPAITGPGLSGDGFYDAAGDCS
jgi:hypothetical protein